MDLLAKSVAKINAQCAEYENDEILKKRKPTTALENDIKVRKEEQHSYSKTAAALKPKESLQVSLDKEPVKSVGMNMKKRLDMPECVTQEPGAVTVSSLQLARPPTDLQTALDSATTCSVITSLPVSQPRDRVGEMLVRMGENMSKIRDIGSIGLVHWGGGGHREKWVCLGEEEEMKDSYQEGTCPMSKVVMGMEKLQEHEATCQGKTSFKSKPVFSLIV